MTVAELIEELKKMPQDAPVFDCVASEVTRVRYFEHRKPSVVID